MTLPALAPPFSRAMLRETSVQVGRTVARNHYARDVERSITGYHQDEMGDWVAELACGHDQHVRHRPPFQLRAWVLDPDGRLGRLGTPLDCPLCDRCELPEGLRRVRTERGLGRAEHARRPAPRPPCRGGHLGADRRARRTAALCRGDHTGDRRRAGQRVRRRASHPRSGTRWSRWAPFASRSSSTPSTAPAAPGPTRPRWRNPCRRAIRPVGPGCSAPNAAPSSRAGTTVRLFAHRGER